MYVMFIVDPEWLRRPFAGRVVAVTLPGDDVELIERRGLDIVRKFKPNGVGVLVDVKPLGRGVPTSATNGSAGGAELQTSPAPPPRYKASVAAGVPAVNPEGAERSGGRKPTSGCIEYGGPPASEAVNSVCRPGRFST